MSNEFHHGALAHFEVRGPDGGALKRFYADVLGWTINDKGPGFSLVSTDGPGPNGAICESPDSALAVGVAVKDLDDALSRAQSAGGTVVMPKTDNGWVKKAQIQDVAGNTLTLIEM